MRRTLDRRFAAAAIALALLCSWQPAVAGPMGQDLPPTPSVVLPNPADLIVEVNNMRLSYGLPILTIHPALNKIAQQVVDGLATDNAGLFRPYGLTLGQWMIMEGYPLSG